MGLLLILLSWVTQLEVREEREEVENSWGKGERDRGKLQRRWGGGICVHVGVDTLILVCVRGRDTIKEKEWRRLEGGRETRRHAAAACTCVFFCVFVFGVRHKPPHSALKSTTAAGDQPTTRPTQVTTALRASHWGEMRINVTQTVSKTNLDFQD